MARMPSSSKILSSESKPMRSLVPESVSFQKSKRRSRLSRIQALQLSIVALPIQKCNRYEEVDFDARKKFCAESNATAEKQTSSNVYRNPVHCVLAIVQS